MNETVVKNILRCVLLIIINHMINLSHTCISLQNTFVDVKKLFV